MLVHSICMKTLCLCTYFRTYIFWTLTYDLDHKYHSLIHSFVAKTKLKLTKPISSIEYTIFSFVDKKTTILQDPSNQDRLHLKLFFTKCSLNKNKIMTGYRTIFK